MTKEIKTVKVPARTIKATTKEVTKVFCDVKGCKKEVVYGRYGSGGCSCEICNRDVCYDHKKVESDYSDSRNYYCPVCYELYIPAHRDLEEKHWDEVEQLRESVKKESLAK